MFERVGLGGWAARDEGEGEQLGKRDIGNRRAQWKEIGGVTYQLLFPFVSRYFELLVTNF